MAISFQPGKLYKLTSTGKVQYWHITTLENEIVTCFGQVDGKEQETSEFIKEGKNIGKANETTAAQQAYQEAQSRYEQKLKKGYVKNIKDAKAGEVDEIIEGGISPMLAHRFDEQGHKIQYPAFVQPKFDGHRCVAIIKDGVATLWSRTRKPITGLPHIIKDLESLGEDIVLDGELYNHSYKDKFEELTSFIRNPEPKVGHEVVQLHIYDVIDNELQAERFQTLKEIIPKKSNSLVPVKTLKAQDEESLMEAFDTFLAEGYEGAIVRNAKGEYVNKRSYDVQKIKEFQDSEFKCIAVEEGRGKLAGHAIFVLQTKEGVAFKAKMKGETEKLRKYWVNPNLAIGKMVTVQYQGITNKSSVPRFPVALRIREDV